jgi:tape measure domain-containing protein
MATSGLDLSLQLNASQRGLSEIQADVSSLVQQFHNATRAIGQVGDLSQLSGESLRQMAQYGQQSLSRLETELAAARLELNRLAATNATPTDIENARKRVEQLTRAVDQTRTAVGAYESAARAAMETPPVPTEFQRQVGSLVNQLENVGRTLDENGNSATHTRQQLEQLATQATEQLRRYEQQLHDARLELNRLSATSASPADIERARSRVQELERGVSQVSSSLDGYRSRARIANNDVASSTNRATESVDRLRSSYGLLRTTVTTLAASLATLGVGLSVKSLADAADSYTNLSARIRISIGDTGNFEQAMAGVHQSALMTNSSLDATAQLYVKINDVGKTMGLTQQQSLDLTNTINMAIKNGGGAAASTEAALYQFNQSLQSGVFRGDEFNSVAEQAPGLLKAMANGLGVTTGELRNMAGQGQITASVALKALQNQSKAVRDEFGKFPPTIGNAIQRIKSQWEILIGTMDQSNGASKTVAQWMMTIANNMDIVSRLLTDIGNGFVWVGDQLKYIDPATIQELKSALSSAYETVKSFLSTLAETSVNLVDMLNTSLEQIFNFSSGIDSAKDKTSGFTKVLQVINVALGFLNDGFTTIGITTNLFTGFIYDLSAAWSSLKAKFTWGDTKTQALADMDAMARKAQEYYQKASNGADQFKSKGVQALNEIGKTQDQKNAEAVSSAKAAMDQILSAKQKEGATSQQVRYLINM